MPRKSLEALTIAPIREPDIWPAAPSHLSERAAAVWTSIVSSREVSYWDSCARFLLAALATHIAAFERVSSEIDREIGADAPRDDRMKLLTQMRASESASMTNLSVKLRLAAQSRYTPELGRRAAIDGAYATKKKLWEDEDGRMPWEDDRPLVRQRKQKRQVVAENNDAA